MITASSDVSVLWIEQATLFAGMSITSHKHDFFHLSFLVEVIDENKETNKDQIQTTSDVKYLQIIPPDCVHFATSIEKTAVYWSFKLNVWDPELHCSMIRLPQFVALETWMVAFLENVMSDITRMAIRPDTLNAAFGYFLHRLVDSVVISSPAPINLANRQSSNIIDYIDKNYATDVTLDSIAKHVGYSKSYTSALFKKEHGITISDYINRVRIKKACELISYSDIPIPDVCSQCGFNDYHNFGRTFKRLMGITPGKYRRSIGDATIICEESQKSYRYSSPVFTYVADAQKLVTWDTVEDYLAQRIKDSSSNGK